MIFTLVCFRRMLILLIVFLILQLIWKQILEQTWYSFIENSPSLGFYYHCIALQNFHTLKNFQNFHNSVWEKSMSSFLVSFRNFLPLSTFIRSAHTKDSHANHPHTKLFYTECYHTGGGSYMKRGQIDKQTEIATLWKNRPRANSLKTHQRAKNVGVEKILSLVQSLQNLTLFCWESE